MKRTIPSHAPRMDHRHAHGRDAEEKERRRREWMIQQERAREHELLKKKKIEEWERKRRAEEESLAKSDKRRSSSKPIGGSKSRSPGGRRKEESQPGASKPSVMSQKFEASNSSTRLFKGPEGTKIDVHDLRRIKVDIHRNLPAAKVDTELRRDIVDPGDVEVKRREGEGAKPIFEREELKKSDVPASEIEERRTVVALSIEKKERGSHSARERSASPTSALKQLSHNSRREIDSRSSRREHSRHSADRSENYRHQRHESEKHRSNYRSKEEPRDRSGRESSRERRTSSHRDASRDHHRDRRERSRSADRDSRRNESRRSSSRATTSYREHQDRSLDDSRDRRNWDDRSREMRVPMPPHYAEAMQVPLYYENYPRHMMVGPMMPIRGQIPMPRGRMSAMMGPMRPPFPPRYMPPAMYDPSLHGNPRFGRMF